MMHIKLSVISICLVILFSLSQPAAADLVRPDSASLQIGTTLAWGAPTSAIENVIDGNIQTHRYLALGEYPGDGTFSFQTVEFDFDQSVDLTHFYLWNNGGTETEAGHGDGEGVTAFELAFYDSSDIQIGEIASFTSSDFGGMEIYEFTAVYEGVSMVEFTITDSGPDDAQTPQKSYVIFHEAAFETAPVPVPSTFGLLGLGLLGLSAISRKRKP